MPHAASPHAETSRLRNKLTILERELQGYEEDILRKKAQTTRRGSDDPPASLSLVLDLDTMTVDHRVLGPEGAAEFFLGKLLAAGVPITLLASGMDLEVLANINPNLLARLAGDKLASLVSSPWARSRPSLYPEMFHINVLTDKVTRTEVGVKKSRALFVHRSDAFPSLIPLITAAEYPLLILDREDVLLSAVHPFQNSIRDPDTCVLTAVGVQSASVRVLVANSRGTVQKEWDAAVIGGEEEAKQLSERLLEVAARPQEHSVGNMEVYGAVKIDFLSILGTTAAEKSHSETSLTICNALLDLQVSGQVVFKGTDEDTVKHIATKVLQCDQNLYVAIPPPMTVPDTLLPRVKAHSHRIMAYPEYHQRLLLFAASSAPEPDREVALACLALIPEIVPEDGAETLNIILSRNEQGGEGEGRSSLQLSHLLHVILSQYSTTIVNSRGVAHLQALLKEAEHR